MFEREAIFGIQLFGGMRRSRFLLSFVFVRFWFNKLLVIFSYFQFLKPFSCSFPLFVTKSFRFAVEFLFC